MGLECLLNHGICIERVISLTATVEDGKCVDDYVCGHRRVSDAFSKSTVVLAST